MIRRPLAPGLVYPYCHRPAILPALDQQRMRIRSLAGRSPAPDRDKKDGRGTALNEFRVGSRGLMVLKYFYQLGIAGLGDRIVTKARYIEPVQAAWIGHDETVTPEPDHDVEPSRPDIEI